MTSRELERCSRKVRRLIDDLFEHPNLVKKRELGKEICRYLDIKSIQEIPTGSRILQAVIELYPGVKHKSRMTYVLCVRLYLLCDLALARRLDARRVSWRNVMAAISVQLSESKSLAWLERLASDPSIRDSDIKAEYSDAWEHRIRLPKNVEDGCDCIYRYALRLAGYAKGLRARLDTRKSQQLLPEDELPHISHADKACAYLQRELNELIAAFDERRRAASERPRNRRTG